MSWLPLKDEGNSLFARGNYQAALEKYTEAINATTGNDEEDKVAVLYANRAACRLNLKRYHDAATDAKKATQLDPGYSKAWGRLATAMSALSSYSGSINAWEKAIETLKSKDEKSFSAPEAKQLQQYQEGLQAAKLAAGGASQPVRGINIPGRHGQLPWDRALSMRAELMAQGINGLPSSAWVILGAYDEFRSGVDIMKSGGRVQTPRGLMYQGHTKAIEGITNGIMRDERVFVIDDPSFPDKLRDQMIFECQATKAWETEGPEAIKEDALRRQRQNGWADVRPALAMTIRGWILRAFLESHAKHNHALAVEMTTNALEVLEWGRSTWRTVAKSDRGVIFSDTFTRCVRSHRLQYMMKECVDTASKRSPLQSAERLNEIKSEADAIIREIGDHPLDKSQEYDPGFVLSFVVYPRAAALAIKGYCHKELVKTKTLRGVEEIRDHFTNAGNCYLEAAVSYPEDDEQHIWFLHCAVDNYFQAGAPIKLTLPMLEGIRTASEKVKKIWEYSALAMQGRDQVVRDALGMEEEIKGLLRQGRYTLEDSVCPERS
ncbi:hypothetical protein OE88DRAFT_1657225 [Heliocybe sulcata]|uniref:Uncharacterized protein n=1 Tax=Heliocybe sulcata TaxID=5364 RepID=A0A5C3N542_9AGAM|nr:hypothetical protein OE88DRAFT_1657225 [Heliocybe sulcata]